MINTTLIGGDGRSKLKIDSVGASFSIQRPLPPFISDPPEQKTRIFRQYLTTDGLANNGTNQDMRVNGSVTNVDFYVKADSTKDLYITLLSFVVSDASLALNEFGHITALTNGCVLLYEDSSGTVTIHDAIKTNFDLLRLCAGSPAFGATTNAFIASNVAGASEAIFPILDLKAVFGFPWGVSLRNGSDQRITLRVKDNISVGLDQFDCIAYGFTRAKDN